MSMVLGNALLLFFVIIELLLIKLVLKEKLPWKEIIINLNSGLILMWIFRGVEVITYIYVIENFSLDVIEIIPYWAQWILVFILWDFCFYWLHRTHHHVKLLWSVHVVHHQGEHYGLTLGIRNSWYSSLSSIPFFLVLAFLGTPIEILIGVGSIHYFIQFYNHNHIVKKSGFLEQIMITPAHHRVHHGKNAPYIDRNFGGTFVFWDKLFGTFQAELEDNPVEFGIDKPIDSYNPITINMVPILEFLGITWKNKKALVKPIETPDYILVSGTFILFILFLFFVYFENSFTIEPKLSLFFLVFLGTIGLGLLSDKNRSGLLIWSISTIVIPTIFLLWFSVSMLLLKLALSVAIAHGLLSIAWYVFKREKSTQKLDLESQL